MKPVSRRQSLHSIFMRLLWVQFFVPILLIALTAISAAAYLGAKAYHDQEIELTSAMSYSVSDYLNRASGVIETLAAHDSSANAQGYALTLALVQHSLNNFETFYLIDNQGTVLDIVPDDGQYLGLDWSGQDFYKDSLTSPSVVISKPFISVRSHQPAVILSKRTPNGGVLAGELNLQELQRITNSTGIQQSKFAEIFVTDEAGNLLAHPNPMWVARQENMSAIPVVRDASRSPQNGYRFYFYNGIPYLGEARRILFSKWLIVSQTPATEVYFPYYGPAVLMLLGSIILLAIFIRLIIRQLQHLIVSPLSQLSRFTSQIADGSHATAGNELQAIPNTFTELTQLMTAVSLMDEAVQKRTQDLENLALNDHLTQLPNRFSFSDQLSAMITQDSLSQQRFALLFIDLDDFKSVNDAFGHASGDEVLCLIGDLLRQPGPDRLLAGRLGGDEFAMVQRVRFTRDAVALAETLLADLNQPMQINHHQIYISPSIGISFFPDDGQQPDVLIQKADTAMATAKREGKNGYQVYSLAMESQAQERHAFSTHLHHALEFNEFSLVYQPIVHTCSRQKAGFETLLRWNNPRLGNVPPARFIPLANETGLILPIGEWILAAACTQGKQWQRPGQALTISVNITERQLKHKRFVDYLARVLGESGLPAHLLRLELTEDIVFQNFKEIDQVLNAIKRLGITLSLDDFGIGYSTLSCLTQIPFDEIKIDRSLVRLVSSSPREAAIVRGILGIAKDLGMKVVAEGIETEAQIQFFEHLNCDLLQGFYFSRPQPPSAF